MNPASPNFPKRQSYLRRQLRIGLLVLGLCSIACGRRGPVVPGSSLAIRTSTQLAPPPLADALQPANPTPAPTSTDTNALPAQALPAEGTFSELPLDGYEPTILWYKHSAPLFVVTHGAGGHAEWHCQHFRRLLDGRATLLCPRGKRRFAHEPEQGYYYPDHLALHREVLAAVRKFESLVGAARPYVYAGYSQGATMGALAFAKEGALFNQLLLVEGGYADWSHLRVTQFQKSGGQSILWICGTSGCNTHAQTAAAHCHNARLDTRISWARGAGHRPDGAVGQSLAENLPFLLDADTRWAGFTPNPEDYSAPRGE